MSASPPRAGSPNQAAIQQNQAVQQAANPEAANPQAVQEQAAIPQAQDQQQAGQAAQPMPAQPMPALASDQQAPVNFGAGAASGSGEAGPSRAPDLQDERSAKRQRLQTEALQTQVNDLQAALQAENQHLRTQLNNTQAQLNNTQAQLNDTQAQLNATQAQTHAMQEQLQAFLAGHPAIAPQPQGLPANNNGLLGDLQAVHAPVPAVAAQQAAQQADGSPHTPPDQPIPHLHEVPPIQPAQHQGLQPQNLLGAFDAAADDVDQPGAPLAGQVHNNPFADGIPQNALQQQGNQPPAQQQDDQPGAPHAGQAHNNPFAWDFAPAVDPAPPVQGHGQIPAGLPAPLFLHGLAVNIPAVNIPAQVQEVQHDQHLIHGFLDGLQPQAQPAPAQPEPELQTPPGKTPPKR